MFFRSIVKRNVLRLEVTLEVDGELQTFSTVQQFHAAAQEPQLFMVPGVIFRVYGEALLMEVEGRDPIVATLGLSQKPRLYNNGYAGLLPSLCQLNRTKDQNFSDYVLSLKERASGSCDFGEDYKPFLITVPNLDVAEEVSYFDIEGENSGVRYHSARLLITDDPVSEGLLAKLPWLENYVGRPTKTLPIYFPDSKAFLTINDFIRERSK